MIAYRTGLDVEEPAPDSYCEREYELWRRSGWAETREHGKTVRDRLLHLAAQLAREALGRGLGTAVERAWLTEPEAVRIGEGVAGGEREAPARAEV